MGRALFALLLFSCGCSAPYAIQSSDDRSASNGPLFFYGWADPPLIPGSRLVDAPSGSRVVLWNEAGLEAVVDLGETCPVLVREGDGARAPTSIELEVIAAVFPAWPLEASTRVGEYAGERRLERRFPAHVRAHFDTLEAGAKVEIAVGHAPLFDRAFHGRAGVLVRATAGAPDDALPRLLEKTIELPATERDAGLRAMVERPGLKPAFLIRIARAGGPMLAVRHAGADESVCIAAIEEIARAPLSSARRAGLEAVLESPGVTPRVRDEVLKVPLSYPSDREAIRAKAASKR